MTLADLPAVNATLNGLSAIFLALGFYHIKRGNKQAHRKSMLAAFGTSILFLICYLTYPAYVAWVLKRGPTVFRDPAWFRPIYLSLLLSHTLLAAAIVPMILISIWRAIKGREEAHRKIARWTWPLWMYVSITGVLIYYLLYIKFPQH